MRGRILPALAVIFLVLLPMSCRNVPGLSNGNRSAGSGTDPHPGVALALAQERVARVSDVRYGLHFDIPDVPGEPVTGTATLRFRLADASRPLALDFAGSAAGITELRVAGRRMSADVRDEHIILPSGALREGGNEIALAFQASDLPLNRQPDFMYTLFVPARARFAFPCFDQPDLKARFTLSLQIPARWEAITNAPEIAREETPGGIRVSFAESAPIPTYLFAFAAGRFAIETAERNGRAYRMLHRETDAQKMGDNRDAVFDLHAAALDWLERYTGIPYPFGKFEFLLVPSFQFGGMEHPGAIFYNASALLLDPSATQNQKLGRASLIAHETAHMWFGDLVTMRWFDDVWMKEVFANFMAAKIVNPSFPQINHELRFLYAHYPAAYEVDRTAGTNAIRQRLENLAEAGSLYGPIIYQKAPIVMRQLEMIVTPGGLRDGLREYLQRHAFGNATWPDLIRLLDGRTPDDLEAWSRAWVEEPGRPIIETTAVRPGADGVLVRLEQKDGNPARHLTWAQRLRLSAGTADGLEHVDVALGGRAADAVLPGLQQLPQFVLPTGGGIGYGEFVLDGRSRTYLTDNLRAVPDPLTRGAAVVTLWEEMLGGRLPPPALFETLLVTVAREPDELNVQRMLASARELFWRFLTERDRNARAARFERALQAGMAAAATPSLTSAWFNVLRDTAATAATLARLERVWEGTERVPGLTLAEPDYMTLALELAVREVPRAAQILAAQRDRITNPDRRAQFEFVMPALSADPATRSAFFDALRDERNRRREAWVLEAVGYLHHPLRATESERFIDGALEVVQDIQRTGDIFFPKRWMDATLGGHRSASAARRVASFLERLPPEYPDRLRRTIISSADGLYRAVRLQQRWEHGASTDEP